jgi:hypothetical protein
LNWRRPEHAGLFEAGADNGLITGLDDTGADEQMLAAELWISHACGISLKVILSFAKTTSPPMSLRGNAFVTVMKATHLR